jgi:hypothetical protein
VGTKRNLYWRKVTFLEENVAFVYLTQDSAMGNKLKLARA